MLNITLPKCYGSPVTSAEVVYLRDVLAAEFDAMVTPCDNPRLRGAWLFRRFRMNSDRALVQVHLQDGSRNIVATLTRED